MDLRAALLHALAVSNSQAAKRADDALPTSVDVLIVGAGHAGLGMSALMTAAGREHLVVDRRERLGGGWQDRWDGFRLVTPN
jgi:cation diffusion facilitator CzcD-associated flavoprotein CzcO